LGFARHSRRWRRTSAHSVIIDQHGAEQREASAKDRAERRRPVFLHARLRGHVYIAAENDEMCGLIEFVLHGANKVDLRAIVQP
jgi:hypothetical protein